MDFQPLIHLFPYFLSIIITAWLGVHAWHRQSVPGGRAFAWVAFFETVWTFGYILQLLTPGLSGKIFWNNVQFIGAIGAPLAYLAFALSYDRPVGLRQTQAFWYCLVPLAIFLIGFIWTDGAHGLFRGKIFLEPGDPFSILVFQRGPGFMLYSIFAYSIIVLTTLLLVSQYLNASQLYQIQIGIVMFGVLFPWITSIVTALELVAAKLHDVTPITFGISNLIIAWALFRYHLFEILPVARDYLVEKMQDGILVLDSALRIIDINPAAQTILSVSKVQAIGKQALQFIPMGDAWPGTQVGKSSVKEEIAIERDGASSFYEMETSLLKHSKGDASIYLIILRDIRDRKKIEDELNHMAVTDALTGINNRGHILLLAQQELERTRKQGHELSLIMIDVDDFKRINDAYGHQIGDIVLRKIAQTCQENLRSVDYFGRYGGEEFLIVLPETGLETAYLVADRLRRKVADLELPERAEGACVSISIGLLCCNHYPDSNLDVLLDIADQALYRAKAEGRNRIALAP